MLAGVPEDVGDDFDGWFRRVDVGVSDHELLQNVILDGACELLQGRALFQACNDIHRHNGKNRSVHCH